MTFNNILKITITALAVICFLACTDNLKEIAKMNAVSSQPINEVENYLLKYTDSSNLKMTMQGPLMLDYAKEAFPYTEFPKGIKVEVYESETDTTKKTTITADYAVLFTETDLVDMNGNVKIVSADGSTFYGQQLYWDQRAKWILTNQPFRTELNNNNRTTGDILDSNEKLSNALVRNASDQFYVKPKDE